MGLASVAVYSPDDRNALHMRMADQACLLDGNTLEETYLNAGILIRTALETGADAIHPGYGFLSENAHFAEAVKQAGITFIGPPPEIIRMMGNKTRARAAVSALGVPVIPAKEGDLTILLEYIRKSGPIPVTFPLIIKAAAGGGGKAMRKVMNITELEESLEMSSREAMNYFGNQELCIENYYEEARHIEFQILADHFGNTIIPGERECTVQRRYQKVIEESPSTFLSADTRKKMFDTSLHIARETGYVNAGTIEYLVDKDQNFYFLEMNTRIQVEHPVTEMVTGLDMVEQQIRIAAGQPLTISGKEVIPRGHAIQARIYAEDPVAGFMPAPGMIYTYLEPSGPEVRTDSGTDGQTMLHTGYDPLIAKVITHGNNRDEALHRLKTALEEFVIAGARTNRTFLLQLIKTKDFIRNRISTGWLEYTGGCILDELERAAAAIPGEKVLALWLAKILMLSNDRVGNRTWREIGYWRQTVVKSVVFNAHPSGIYVNRIRKDHFIFNYEGVDHQVQIHSVTPGEVIISVDGVRISGAVSSGYDIEDMVFFKGFEFRLRSLDFLPSEPFIRDLPGQASDGFRIIKSPLHGRIVKLNATTGSKVSRGELLFILDTMKIENRIISPFDGHIREIRVNTGDQVAVNQPVLVIE